MKKTQQPAPYSLRISADLRNHLEQKAKENGRSLHAEIVARLVASADYQPDEEKELETKIRQIVRDELARANK